MRLAFALLVFVTLSCCAGPAWSGDPPEPRWGVGWEQGLSVKYRSGAGWVYGFRIDPRLLVLDTHESRNKPSSTGPDEVVNSQRASELQSLGLGLMAFRQMRLGRYAAVGPYAELFYGVAWDSGSRERDEEETYSYVASDSHTHRLGLELGIRPSFFVEERLILSARLGFRVFRQSKAYEDRRQATGAVPVERTREADTWSFTTLGQNLSLTSALAFTIFF